MTKNEFITEIKESLFDFKKINNDVNGNPRYLVHFFKLLRDWERYSNMSMDEKYSLAIERSRGIGGKVYRGKDFGGGIVFQSYNIDHDLGVLFDIVYGS